MLLPHKDVVTDTMKTIEFKETQTIGATVYLSTLVPVKNAIVIAFPITNTGKIVLTY